MPFKWSPRSLRELKGIHPDLRKVADRALELSPVDFIITDGLRTLEEQRKLVARGASQTLHSRHLTGHAVDFVALVGQSISYELTHMKAIADAFKAAADEFDIPIEWGGDWKSFKDTPHIELNRRAYPA